MWLYNDAVDTEEKWSDAIPLETEAGDDLVLTFFNDGNGADVNLKVWITFLNGVGATLT